MRDPLSPARGILVGLVLGVVFWLLAGAIALVIVTAMRDEVVRPVECKFHGIIRVLEDGTAVDLCRVP